MKKFAAIITSLLLLSSCNEATKTALITGPTQCSWQYDTKHEALRKNIGKTLSIRPFKDRRSKDFLPYAIKLWTGTGTAFIPLSPFGSVTVNRPDAKCKNTYFDLAAELGKSTLGEIEASGIFDRVIWENQGPSDFTLKGMISKFEANYRAYNYGLCIFGVLVCPFSPPVESRAVVTEIDFELIDNTNNKKVFTRKYQLEERRYSGFYTYPYYEEISFEAGFAKIMSELAHDLNKHFRRM